MTTSPNPNHAEEALVWLEHASADAEMPTALATVAQVHATLALEAQTARLADEARTANLITLATAGIQLGGPGDPTEQWRIIAARLDLTQDVTPVAHTGNDEYDDQLERLGLS